jgi:preprotein translocase subunit SecG
LNGVWAECDNEAVLAAAIVILVLIAIPVVVLLRRLREGDATAGGSDGRQLFRGRDDDWGPKS